MDRLHRMNLSRAALIVFAYWALAKIALVFATMNGNLTVVWLPSGFAVFVLLTMGSRRWPAILAGAFLAGVSAGDAYLVSLLIALGNTLEPLAIAWALKRMRFDIHLRRGRDYTVFLPVVFLVAFFNALLGGGVLTFAGIGPMRNMLGVMQQWWMGDVFGVVLLTPLLLLWRKPRHVEGLRQVEFAVLFAGAFLVGQIVFDGWFQSTFSGIARPTLMVPFVIWAAFRFGRHGISLLSLMIFSQGYYAATQSEGYFADDIAKYGMTGLWLYNMSLTVAGMFLALIHHEREVLHQRLHERESQYRQLFDNMPSGAVVYRAVDGGRDFEILEFNSAAEKIEHTGRASVIGKRITSAFPGAGKIGLLDAMNKVWRGGQPVNLEAAWYDDGRIRGWRENYVYRLPCGNLVVIYNDVTQRVLVEQDLKMTASVVEYAHEGIMITDARKRIVRVNEAFSRVTGYTRGEAVGCTPSMIQSGMQDKNFYDQMWASINRDGYWSGEIWNRRKNGEVYPEALTIFSVSDEQGRIEQYVGMFSDISLLKQKESQLERMAHYDSLTGLPNRVLLFDRMGRAVVQARREARPMAVCYLDLDGFKPINDIMGHKAGDAVLVEVARRIEQTIRAGDTAARVGGDEFVILLVGLLHEEECEPILQRLLDSISQPIELDGEKVSVTASVGVAVCPKDCEDSDILLRCADMAMYRAKEMGKSRRAYWS